MTSNHPDFDAAPAASQWTGRVAELFPVLAADAYHAHGRWAARVLPLGAWVLMRCNEQDNYRLEVKVKRREAPAPEDAAAFEREVAGYIEQLAPDLGRRWAKPFIEVVPWKDGSGNAIEASAIALFVDEAAKGRVRCAGPGGEATCTAIIEYNPLYNPNRCETCARLAGSREAREVVERRLQSRTGREPVQPYGGHA